MDYGFVKVRAVTCALKLGDPAANAEAMAYEAERAYEAGVEILVFPELSLTGYTLGDLFLQSSLTDACRVALEKLCEATRGKKMLVFAGLPVVRGNKLYNCAAALCNGEVLAFIPKTHLPNYGEFYELRQFTPAPEEGGTIAFAGREVPFATRCLFSDPVFPDMKVAAEICEDLWAPVPPSVEHAAAGATVIVNLSASDETVGKREYRQKLMSAHSGKIVSAYVYADAGAGESVSDLVFAGNDFIYENGAMLSEAKPFSGDYAEAEIDAGFLNTERKKLNTFAAREDGRYLNIFRTFLRAGKPTLRRVSRTPFVPEEQGELQERSELILNLQAQALARRLQHTNAKTAVLGVSGGLDSTLALLVAARACDIIKKPRSTIFAITMPGFGTTGKTKNNALALIRAVGANEKTVNIAGTVLKHFEDIGQNPEEFDVTYENAQARYRTMVLMDLANKTGGLVIGTGDLSELALGWCTYNGDHMSMYSVNSSVPKTLVKHLVAYEAKRLGGEIEKVLSGVLATEISPELLPPDEKGNIAQKTEDIVGPYELHDFYLYRFLRRGDSPAKTLFLAERAFEGKYDRATLKKWLVNFYRRFFNQQFKRNCVPDGVKVGSVSLSPRGDWRMPSDAANVFLKEAEAL